MIFLNCHSDHLFAKIRVKFAIACTLLSKQQTAAGRKAKKKLEQHYLEADRSFQVMKTDFTTATLPGNSTFSIAMDLQKVFPVPKLGHSSMYYSRQLSVYNFGIHLTYTNNAVMCVWHEGVAGRGGNEIASSLLNAINE